MPIGRRLIQVHEDVLENADPENLGRWTQFWRKIGKTVYAVYDHKKAAAAAWAVGVAASIALGVVTGGASLLIQFAVGTAYALTKAAGGKVVDYVAYKRDKKKLEELKQGAPENIGREGLRTVKDSLDYNEEHLKTAIYKATQAFLQLTTWRTAANSMRQANNPNADQSKIVTLSAKQAEKLLADMYNFYFEYDRALHYFSQYEVFVEYSHAFVAAQAEWYNNRVIHWDRAIEDTVNAKYSWHAATCRKSVIKKDICYGPKNAPPRGFDRDGYEKGAVHHGVLE